MKRKMFEYTAIRSWLYRHCMVARDKEDWNFYHYWADRFNALQIEIYGVQS